MVRVFKITLESEFPTVSLDNERRIKGICQLMEGLVFNLSIPLPDSQGGLAEQMKLMTNIMDSLDAYLLMAHDLIEKQRRLGRIKELVAKKYRKIVEKKYDEVAEVIIVECSFLESIIKDIG